MEIWQYFIIFSTGLIAGIINTIAGGGSLLTLPVLIFFGLPASVANGTNRLALVMQSTFAVAGFRKKGVSNIKFSLLLTFPALCGAILGAQLAIALPEQLFKKVLACIMLFVLVLIIWNSVRKKISDINHVSERANLSRIRVAALMTVFFFVGIYSGFIQAGVGIIIIAVLTTISGLNLIETNSHKVFIIGIVSILSLTVFAFHNKISWSVGIAMAAGNGFGGWIGSQIAVAKGEIFIRIVLVCVVTIMAIKLLM